MAKVTYYDPNIPYDIVEYKVGDHHLRDSPDGTGGFCYEHQGFDCKLTEAEEAEVQSTLQEFNWEYTCTVE